jgi:integrase
MARALSRLTDLTVRRATTPGLLADGGGLYLKIAPSGSKSWVFRYRQAGKLRDMGLGPLHTLSLAEARQRALACRKQRLDGVDPLDERRAARAAAALDAARSVTFEKAAESFIAAHRAGWRNEKHATQWPTTLQTYVYPIFGNLPVSAIDTGLVMKAMEPIWATKPETASRVRGRIESVLDWAGTRGYRQGENPARWRGHLENLLPKKSKVATVEHHAALPYAELPAFMAELNRQDDVAAQVLRFAIVTGARSGEALNARWQEIDLVERVWTVPASRIKAGREHRVPLSDAALAILNRMAELRQSDYVFPGQKARRPISRQAFPTVLRRIGRDDLTTHGFRSTFCDWIAERTAFPHEVAEIALAHAVGNKVEATYRRGDLFEKRRQLMDAWAQYCTTSPPDGKVLPIRRRKA